MLEYYSVVGVLGILVCILVARCNRLINEKKSRKRFRIELVAVVVFCSIDAFWGLCAGRKISVSTDIFALVSFMFHLAALFSSYLWLRYTEYAFKCAPNKIAAFIELTPLLAGLALIFIQIFNPVIFYIDSDLAYKTGNLRGLLFSLEGLYFIYSFFRVLIVLIRDRQLKNAEVLLSCIEINVVPLIATIIQCLFPGYPVLSLGYIILIVCLFNGLIVTGVSRSNTEKYNALSVSSGMTQSVVDTLAKGFVSIHLFDLTLDKQYPFKSTDEVDSFILPEDNGHDQIKKVMQGVVAPQYREGMAEFVDTYTLSERMKENQIISKEFIGMNKGWCLSSFSKVEEDDAGNVTKVIHVVQSIDAMKKREKEYTDALTRAYEDQNAINGEIIRMQSTGVIVTDGDECVIMANDRAMEMFNCKVENPKGMTFESFTRFSKIEDYETASSAYDNLTPNGEGLTYRVTVFKDGRIANNRYLIAEVKKLVLLDETQVMVTCYTDVTEIKLLEDKLRLMSEKDALTRIDNRGCGEAKIQYFLEQQQEGLFCIIDIDRFKSINDTYGHKAGDMALIAVANAIRSSFRNDDVIMRLGGDEFAVFAKSVITKELAESKFASLFSKIEKIELEDIPKGYISISLGAFLIMKDRQGYIREDFGSIYQKADRVMYESKGIKGNSRIFV